MTKFKIFLLTAALCASAFSVEAAVKRSAKKKPAETVREAPKANPHDFATGEALKKKGKYEEAIPHLLKGGTQGLLQAAEAAFYAYRFDDAREYLDQYLDKRSESDAAKDKDFTYSDSSAPIDWTERLGAQIEMGKSMLDRVEKIQVIDSINVPAHDFFNLMRIARSAGSLRGQEMLESMIDDKMMQRLKIVDLWGPAYVSESGDGIIWHGSDAEGRSKMFESTRLADGSWDTPAFLFDYKSIFGNTNGSWVAYPYLMNDGVTMYFAADGAESLGELDIFISRRDENGFLQPSNIGMPYNSPFNDYMLVIDEETGAGWWASDRTQVPDSVTIYTFIPQELRINYPIDSPKLTAYARLNRIKDTQPKGADYSALRSKIQTADELKRTASAPEFEFSLPSGRVLRRLSDFNSTMARNAMKQYLDELRSYEAMRRELAELRAQYAAGNRDVAPQILEMERNADRRRADLRALSNQVATMEL